MDRTQITKIFLYKPGSMCPYNETVRMQVSAASRLFVNAQALSGGKLDGLVAVGTGVHILGGQLGVLLKEVRHGPGPHHALPVFDSHGCIVRLGLAHGAKILSDLVNASPGSKQDDGQCQVFAWES